MTAKQLIHKLSLAGIQNQQVLTAMADTPRHLFVDAAFADQAYQDRPLPLSHGQTISQPFVVARMTELLLAGGTLNKVLEIGTGSGYQAAILARLVQNVYSIERIKTLYKKAQVLFQQLKLNNIFLRFADGNAGWPEQAPFDGIIVTAATPTVPAPLLNQLQDGGRMIIPVGSIGQPQRLQLITRKGLHFSTQDLDPVIFVPLLSDTEK